MLKFETLVPEIDILVFLMPKLWPEDPKLLGNMLSKSRGLH